MRITELFTALSDGMDPGLVQRMCQHRVRLHLPGARVVATRELVSEMLFSLFSVTGGITLEYETQADSGEGRYAEAALFALDDGSGGMIAVARGGSGGIQELRIEFSPGAGPGFHWYTSVALPAAGKLADPVIGRDGGELPPGTAAGGVPRGGVTVYEDELRFGDALVRCWLYAAMAGEHPRTFSGITIEYAGTSGKEQRAFYLPAQEPETDDGMNGTERVLFSGPVNLKITGIPEP